MMADSQPASVESDVSYWLGAIERSQQTAGMQKWNERCIKIRKKYRYETSDKSRARQYQMLWSNMETMKPAVYSKPPKPVVSRRWRDKDPVARVATQMLERSIGLQMELNDFNSEFIQVRDDYLLYARGVVRLKYEPVFDTLEDDEGEPDLAAVEGPQAEVKEETNEAGADAPAEIIKFENVEICFVQREDFAHSTARTWKEVTWVAFRAFMTKEELVDRFGEEIGEAIPMEANPDRASDAERSASGDGQPDEKAIIWEIWHKTKRRVLWVAKGYPKVLENGDPYLKLEGFFPCPRPVYGTLTNDSLEPIPDYVFYQDQCEEIDALTARIGALQDSLKLVGFYPAGPQGEGAPEIERAVTPGFENKLIAVKAWAAFTQDGKNGTPIVWLPVEQVIKVLEGCVKLRQQLIEDVYQIYGLSDIMRGDGKASETATAQNIKAQYGSVRIRDRQSDLATFCRDVCRLVGEIICTQFQPETLMAMSNMPLPTDQELQQQALIAQQQAAQQAAMAQQQAAMAAQQQQQMPPQGVQQQGAMAQQGPPMAGAQGMPG